MINSQPLPQLDLTITAPSAGWRLDKILSCQPELAHLSRSRLQNLILAGDILVNGKRQKTGYRVKEGDTVKVVVSAAQPQTAIMAKPVDFAIIYEDADIIVVNKPSGLVVHPAPGHYQDTLVNGLLYHCDDLSGVGGEVRPGIVHRLDKDTSGLLVAAKNDQSHNHLASQFQQRRVKKVYHAILAGKLPQPEGRLTTMLGRHPIQRKKMAVVKNNGRNAITSYSLLAKTPLLSLVELQIETGRTHQIRVHMAYLGCPVLGDPIYGGKKSKIVSTPRLCLHASQLQFINPGSGEVMTFKVPFPPELDNVLQENDLLRPII